MRIKTPVSVTIASSPHPRMAEPLSHPLDPLGARVRPSRKAGVPAPFALRSASTIALGVRLVGGRATLDSLVYGMPRPARGTTPRVQIGSCVDGGASLIRYELLK
jgi:hypothetical protein